MAVSFVAAGTFAAGGSTLSVAWPSHSAGDVGLLLVESAVYGDTVSASGWTEVSASPVGNVAAAHKLSAFYRVAESGSESNASVGTATNHIAAQILVFSGVDGSTPINATAGSKGATGTSITVPAVTTTVANCAIIHIAGTGRDFSSTTTFDSWANANLTSITEIADGTTGTAGGGGFGAAWGILASAGSSGDGTVTQVSSISWSGITIALAPASSGAVTTSNASPGSFTITGSSSTGTRSLQSTASPGTFTITGAEASGTYSPASSTASNADAGSYTVTGVSSTGTRALISQASPGSYTIIGAASTGAYIPAGSITSYASPGAYMLTGSASTGVRNLLSNAEAGSITVTGYASSATKTLISNASPANYTITGAETSETWQHVSEASPGAWTITGYPLTGANPDAVAIAEVIRLTSLLTTQVALSSNLGVYVTNPSLIELETL